MAYAGLAVAQTGLEVALIDRFVPAMAASAG